MSIRVCRLSAGFPKSVREVSQGIQPSLYYISKELSKLGVDEHVICLGDLRRRELDGIDLHCVKRPYTLNATRKFRELMREMHFDIVHGHSADAFPYVLSKLISRTDAPLVAHAHEVCLDAIKYTLPPIGRDGRGFLKMASWYYFRLPIREKLIFSTADRIIAVSNYIAQRLRECYNISLSKVAVIHNGVDVSLFRPINKEEAKERIGLGDRPIVLYVGAFTLRKGIHYLIRSFRMVVDRFKDACLMLIGGVPSWYGSSIYYDILYKEINKLDLKNSVIVKGKIPHNRLPIYYSAADVFALPSIYEPFGKVLLEAMACETPVVASNVGGIPEIVRDGESGFLVAPGDIEELYESISKLLSSNILVNKMGSYGRLLVMKEFTWELVAMRLMNVYMELLSNFQG
ncbi:glycosyltransferase family 4 protein [Candidatus Bathyarchaeota archaeon]|nr:glycosyltransferase family 4 protein [Candidatus Bathyarchaeota archaeon]